MKASSRTTLILEFTEEEKRLLHDLAKTELQRATGAHVTVRRFLEQLETATGTP